MTYNAAAHLVALIAARSASEQSSDARSTAQIEADSALEQRAEDARFDREHPSESDMDYAARKHGSAGFGSWPAEH